MAYHRNDNRRQFTVVIYEEEYRQLCSWVLKKPNIETGGDLFGLWQDKYTAVVQFVLGPGKRCRRTTSSFFQDVDYLKRVGSHFTEEEGLCHIGEWHSHHTHELARPSGGDENTVWSNMPSYHLQRFFLFIANILSDNTPKVGCFLFELDDRNGRQLPVLQGKFRILPNARSPFRSKVATKTLLSGCESVNGADQLRKIVIETGTGPGMRSKAHVSLETSKRKGVYDHKQTHSKDPKPMKIREQSGTHADAGSKVVGPKKKHPKENELAHPNITVDELNEDRQNKVVGNEGSARSLALEKSSPIVRTDPENNASEQRTVENEAVTKHDEENLVEKLKTGVKQAVGQAEEAEERRNESVVPFEPGKLKDTDLPDERHEEDKEPPAAANGAPTGGQLNGDQVGCGSETVGLEAGATGEKECKKLAEQVTNDESSREDHVHLMGLAGEGNENQGTFSDDLAIETPVKETESGRKIQDRSGLTASGDGDHGTTGDQTNQDETRYSGKDRGKKEAGSGKEETDDHRSENEDHGTRDQAAKHKGKCPEENKKSEEAESGTDGLPCVVKSKDTKQEIDDEVTKGEAGTPSKPTEVSSREKERDGNPTGGDERARRAARGTPAHGTSTESPRNKVPGVVKPREPTKGATTMLHKTSEKSATEKRVGRRQSGAEGDKKVSSVSTKKIDPTKKGPSVRSQQSGQKPTTTAPQKTKKTGPDVGTQQRSTQRGAGRTGAVKTTATSKKTSQPGKTATKGKTRK